VVSPADPNGIELLPEPNNNPALKGAEAAFQKALVKGQGPRGGVCQVLIWMPRDGEEKERRMTLF
jgi:hypothetical protein